MCQNSQTVSCLVSSAALKNGMIAGVNTNTADILADDYRPAGSKGGEQENKYRIKFIHAGISYEHGGGNHKTHRHFPKMKIILQGSIQDRAPIP